MKNVRERNKRAVDETQTTDLVPIPTEQSIKELMKQRTANPGGRPTKYSKEIGEEICARIACGESLLRITQDEHMPGYRTVMTWQLRNTKFRHNYVRARAQQAETYADALVDLAMTEDDVNRARLVSDNIKWTASKLLPKVYGDKVEHEQNINVSFSNGVPRPKIIDLDPISSVPPQIEAN